MCRRGCTFEDRHSVKTLILCWLARYIVVSADEAFLSQRDIIVVGASAGGIEALRTLMSGLPVELQAAVFVVLHFPPYYTSDLPNIINRSCNGCLSAAYPNPGEPMQRGRVYVARPDYHLLVEADRVHLWRGPKENMLRPSANALFRSAAVAYKERVIGVVLSGTLDDGSTGLWWIKHFGGLAVVQDPQDAAFPDMPQNALNYTNADYIVRAAEMGPLLAKLVEGPSEERSP